MFLDANPGDNLWGAILQHLKYMGISLCFLSPSKVHYSGFAIISNHTWAFQTEHEKKMHSITPGGPPLNCCVFWQRSECTTRSRLWRRMQNTEMATGGRQISYESYRAFLPSIPNCKCPCFITQLVVSMFATQLVVFIFCHPHRWSSRSRRLISICEVTLPTMDQMKVSQEYDHRDWQPHPIIERSLFTTSAHATTHKEILDLQRPLPRT